MFRFVSSILFSIFIVFGSTSEAAESTRSSEAPNPALLYHNYCSVCHGDRGDGQSKATKSLNPPPRDFTSVESQSDLLRPRIVHAISNGRPGTAMSAWLGQLTELEIEALADYLISQFINARETLQNHAGRKLYMKNCAVCHGDKGDGGRWTSGMKFKPRDFTSERGQTLSRESMVNAVTHGIPGTPMVSYAGPEQLSTDEIGQTVDYIRLAFMSVRPEIKGLSGTRAHGLPSQPNKNEVSAIADDEAVDMNALMTNELIGNVSQGRDFYMNNCITCHGAAGDGKGPRAYFINPKPANFFADKYQQEMNRPALFKGIKFGRLRSEMPAWGQVLSDQQIADVAEFVFQAYIKQDPSAFKDQLKKKSR